MLLNISLVLRIGWRLYGFDSVATGVVIEFGDEVRHEFDILALIFQSGSGAEDTFLTLATKREPMRLI